MTAPRDNNDGNTGPQADQREDTVPQQSSTSHHGVHLSSGRPAGDAPIVCAACKHKMTSDSKLLVEVRQA